MMALTRWSLWGNRAAPSASRAASSLVCTDTAPPSWVRAPPMPTRHPRSPSDLCLEHATPARTHSPPHPTVSNPQPRSTSHGGDGGRLASAGQLRSNPDTTPAVRQPRARRHSAGSASAGDGDGKWVVGPYDKPPADWSLLEGWMVRARLMVLPGRSTHPTSLIGFTHCPSGFVAAKTPTEGEV